MKAWSGKQAIAVVSACMQSDGTPTFVLHEVEVSQEEYEEGLHYDLVNDRLHDAGYDEPYVHFDQFEGPAFLHPAVRNQIRQREEACHVSSK